MKISCPLVSRLLAHTQKVRNRTEKLRLINLILPCLHKISLLSNSSRPHNTTTNTKLILTMGTNRLQPQLWLQTSSAWSCDSQICVDWLQPATSEYLHTSLHVNKPTNMHMCLDTTRHSKAAENTSRVIQGLPVLLYLGSNHNKGS